MSLRRRPNPTHNPNPAIQQPEPTNLSSSSSSSSSVILSSEKRIWTFCLFFRAINSLLVQTYFNPDEHWQSLEIAHKIAFGYGHVTWEWKEGIRSYLHPLIFALLYKVLEFLCLDTPWLMAKAPRLLQSVFASFGDLYLYKLSRYTFDDRVAKWALFSQLANWFVFYCITRTFSNSLETVLTVVALFYWASSSRMVALFVAGVACAIRPTSAVIWLYMGIVDLFRKKDRLGFLFLEVLPIGFLVLALTCLVDWSMYGSWIFVPLNFLKFNFLSSGGDFYGTHKWHWYFTQGFTVMLFTFLPFSVVGIFKSKEWRFSGLVAWVLGVYSILGHKEFRFVLPVLPIALMFSGYSLAAMSTPVISDTTRRKSNFHITCPSRRKLAILFLIISNLPMALYMSLVHQRGTEDVMHYLSNKAQNGEVESILFLMPCHSTPYYSTLHTDLPMRFLDCSPSESTSALVESDRFMMDPVNFAASMFKNSSLHSHIVLFDSEERHLQPFLNSHSFKKVKRFFHAHFKVDRELQGFVAVYAWTDQ